MHPCEVSDEKQRVNHEQTMSTIRRSIRGVMMMNRDEQQRRRPALRVFLLAAFVMMLLLGLPDRTLAQSQWTTNGNNINNTNTGNVGIGTASPTDKLEVVGTKSAIAGDTGQLVIRDGSSSVSADMGGQIAFGFKYNGANFANPAIITGAKENSTNANWSGYLAFSTAAHGTSNTEKMRITSSGNVGIGTTSPTNLLQINSGYTPASGQFRISANNAGSLSGIAYSPNNIALGFDVDYTNGLWMARDTSVATLYKTASKFFIQGSAGNTVGGGATFNNYLAVDLSTGNVGIGTTSPTTKLHVAGDITVTGNINAKYQDVAEWVPATHALPAGTVVVLNPNQSNQVMASAKSYDTRVAGVISERPGIALGEAGTDKVLVATTGRVKVKVDATLAPIYVGDLLVTSDKEGVAMKSIPLDLGGTPIHRPGTLIGKALESLEKGTGEILVLLSLQ
jgi:hypothetical protein